MAVVVMAKGEPLHFYGDEHLEHLAVGNDFLL
jgi:hypothetical protein